MRTPLLKRALAAALCLLLCLTLLPTAALGAEGGGSTEPQEEAGRLPALQKGGGATAPQEGGGATAPQEGGGTRDGNTVTVRFFVPTGAEKPEDMVCELGDYITLPVLPSMEAEEYGDMYEYRFVGWVNEMYDHVDWRPSDVFTNRYYPQTDIALRALFGLTTSEPGVFRLVEEPPEDWNGRYCITGNATPQCANNLWDSYVLKCSPVELSYEYAEDSYESFLDATEYDESSVLTIELGTLPGLDERYIFEIAETEPGSGRYTIRSSEYDDPETGEHVSDRTYVADKELDHRFQELCAVSEYDSEVCDWLLSDDSFYPVIQLAAEGHNPYLTFGTYPALEGRNAFVTSYTASDTVFLWKEEDAEYSCYSTIFEPQFADIWIVDQTNSEEFFCHVYNSGINPGGQHVYGSPMECLGKDIDGNNYYCITIDQNWDDTLFFSNTEEAQDSPESVVRLSGIADDKLVFYNNSQWELSPGEDVWDSSVNQILTEPGCETAGEGAWIGLVFETRLIRSIPALGHDLIHHEAQDPTCTEIGWAAYDTCSRCDYSTYVETPALGHDLVHHEAQEPTCTEIGWAAYDTCSRCDYSTYQETPALGHDLIHHEAQEPTCTEIGWQAYDTCSRCDYSTYQETPALGHDLIHHEAQEPTCTEIGWAAYDTCSRCDYSTYEETPALGHDLIHHEAQEPTCNEIGWAAYDTCSRCDYSTYQETPALGHDLIHHEAQDPTCTEIGWEAYDTCSRCDYSTYVETPALGHELVHHEAQAPTCNEIGWAAYDTCSRCDYSTYVETPALGHDLIHHEAQEPTCTEIGWEAYDTCSRCDYSTYEETPALGHDLIHHEAQEPTCTEIGWEAYDTCSRCDYSTYSEEAALGHIWGEAEYVWEEDFSSVTATVRCTRNLDHELTETVAPEFYIVTPSTFETTGAGYYLAEFADEHFEDQRIDVEIPMVACEGGDACPSSHFTDMPPVTSYSHIPIDWAVVNHITAGTSPTTFGPKEAVTRGQVVTFLWAVAGKPEPASEENPFTDVQPGKYYYKAVLWAVENGVTSGVTPTTFGPKQVCSRAQVVTFLWAAKGRPEPKTAENPFTDVSSGAWYYKAVLWAFENGVTGGTSDTNFSPKNLCTREQVVTFLYKVFGQDD